MGLLDKVKKGIDKAGSSSGGGSGGGGGSTRSYPAAPAAPPLEQSMTRYRRQRGINLGSWFTTEDWLATELYKHAADPKRSDYDLARAPDAKQLMEHHWDTWITDADWQWIRDKGFNTVRLPIGYYHLASACPEALKGTDFERYAAVYEGAWQRILAAVDTAGKYGLGVLIDLHSAAGAQNTDAHSGLSSGKVGFWSKGNLGSTSAALRFLASTFAGNPTVVGLELLNEPKNDNRLQGWYESTLNDVRGVAGPEFPVYLSDAWDTDHYAKWAGQRKDFVVVDHHLYRCFDGGDKRIDGRGHADKLCHEFGPRLAGWCSEVPVVVGEWSAGLDDSCLPPDTPAGERDAQKRAFVAGQLDLYDRVAAGYYFWTLKTDREWDAGWSAYNAAQAEILPASMIRRSFRPPSGDRDAACQQACNSHCDYWNSNGGGANAQVFSAAFSKGWDDAAMFLGSDGANELGFVKPWGRRRMQEYEAAGGAVGNAAWQWDHGFAQGVAAINQQCLS